MSTLKDSEKNNFEILMKEDGENRDKEKLNIIDVFLGTKGHITLMEINQLLRSQGYEYSPDFVKRLMDRMVDLGFAQKKEFNGQPVRFEHRHLGRHHDHLICTKCGKIIEFADESLEKLQERIAAEQGFYMLQHKMEIYGLCSECHAERKPLMPLSVAKSGELVQVKDMTVGGNAQARLASMGLRLGDTIEIINNTGQGRLIVGRDCTRLAIGRGIAEKIIVSVARNSRKAECEPDQT